MAVFSHASSHAVAMPQAGHRSSAFRRQHVRHGFLFLSPWLIGFLAFQFLPILATIILSFTDYAGTNELTLANLNFVGLGNYAKVLTDLDFLRSMGVTLKFVAIAVPLGLFVPLFFAVLVNSKHLLGVNVFRTLFFLPTVIPIVAGAMVFNGVLNGQSGWLNMALRAIGIEGPGWLTDPAWAVPALNLLALWGVGNGMIILLAGLQGVPTDILEAAIIDGANGLQRFVRITLPMMSPVIFYNVTMGFITSFQYFVPAMLIGGRNGDPQKATLFYNLHFYREAFVFNDLGYGSVLAIVLFVIVMVVTALMFSLGQRAVYYAGGEA